MAMSYTIIWRTKELKSEHRVSWFYQEAYVLHFEFVVSYWSSIPLSIQSSRIHLVSIVCQTLCYALGLRESSRRVPVPKELSVLWS